MLRNLPEIPLREERGSFDRIFKGSEGRKPQQCQVYAPLSSACSTNQLFLLYGKDHRMWSSLELLALLPTKIINLIKLSSEILSPSYTGGNKWTTSHLLYCAFFITTPWMITVGLILYVKKRGKNPTKLHLVVQGHHWAQICSQIYRMPKSLFFSTVLHITLSCVFLPSQIAVVVRVAENTWKTVLHVVCVQQLVAWLSLPFCSYSYHY